MKGIVSAFVLTIILVGALVLAFEVQPVKAMGTIYIRADGSIEPLDAPIITYDHVTYALTGNITSSGDGIVVQRDNIIVDGVGYTLQGSGHFIGIDVSSRSNVTVRNIHITSYYDGIVLDSSSSSIVSGNTITANSYRGIRLSHSSSNTISGNTIANGWVGILLDYSSSNSVSGNTVTANNEEGIWLSFSSSNTISGNTIANNDYTPTGISESGIRLDSGSSNTVSGNTFTNDGLWVLHSFSNSVANNTVNGKPLVYLEGVADYTVVDAGQVILVRCENIRVEGLNLSRTSVGIELSDTNNSTISGNTITANHWDGITILQSSNSTISGNTITANNGYGITHSYSSNSTISGNTITANYRAGLYLHFSSSNSVSGNAIASNDYAGIYLQYSCMDNHISANDIMGNPLGIEAYSSPGNRLYHNNFIDNTQQVYSIQATNIWDDGYPSGGNYWSDYAGTDKRSGASQDQPGSDGIGDTPYVINTWNQDRYPLTERYPGNLHDLGIAHLDVSQLVVRQGSPLHGSVTIFNYGNTTEYCNVTVYADSSVIHTSEHVMLDGGSSWTIAFTWNTAGVALGDHTISAYVSQVPGEADLSNNLQSIWILVTIPGDVDGDLDVDMFDVVAVCSRYGCLEGDFNWNPMADLAPRWGVIDIFDCVTVAYYYGMHA